MIPYNFLPNNEITYIPTPLYKKNPFPTREPETGELPTYENSLHLLPRPFWKGHEDTIACHDKAWQIAFKNLRMPTPGSGFVSAFIDTAFNNYLFMWDSSFIVMFGRYGSHAFNFQKTLDNMYARQHVDGFICRELREVSPGEHFSRFDPCATGPAIMAWSEWEYYKTTADKERLADVYYPLLAYHHWLQDNHTWRDGTYWSSGWGCGMDNQPRMDGKHNVSHSHGHMIWADTCFQAILDARVLTAMARELGHEEDIPRLEEEIERLTRVVNERLWSEEDAFYYDEWQDGRLNGVKTIGAYWALLAGVVPEERIERFVAHLDNEAEFKRPGRVPTLSADNPHYLPEGGYWCGGVWAPTNYMVLKGLDTINASDLAFDIASNCLAHATAVFNETGTLWENYAPEFAEPGYVNGHCAAKDFVGWTGLIPIAIMYEYVMGIKSDPVHGKLRWDVRLPEEHGIENYPFGEHLISLHCAARSSADEEPVITVTADCPIEVEVIWKGGKKVFMHK